MDAPNLTNMTLKEAKRISQAAGFIVRVMEINGKGMVGTCDLRMDRINISVSQDEIASHKNLRDEKAIVVKQDVG